MVQDFRQSHESILNTPSSNNIKLGARGFNCGSLKVVQDFFHQQYLRTFFSLVGLRVGVAAPSLEFCALLVVVFVLFFVVALLLLFLFLSPVSLVSSFCRWFCLRPFFVVLFLPASTVLCLPLLYLFGFAFDFPLFNLQRLNM